MSYSFTRIAGLVLAFGFFISCSTLNPTKNQTTSVDKLSETELEQGVGEINDSIASGDSSDTIFFKRGLYLIKLAQKKSPSKRMPLYRDARSSLQLIDRDPDEDIRQLLSVSWSNEHNHGVKILQDDSTLDEKEYSRAGIHFENATVVIPDSIVSYEKGVQAYYKSGQPEKAISLLEKGQKNIDSLPEHMLEQLAYLYLENGEGQKAISIYEEAEEFSEQNLNLMHGLSNAYIRTGEHKKAIAILENLSEMQPSNLLYRESLATELYLLANQKIDSLVSKGNVTEGNLENIDRLLSKSVENLSTAVKRDSTNNSFTESLANLYLNIAANYQQLAEVCSDSQNQQVKSKINNYLSSSLPLLQTLTKAYPDRNIYWKDLYQAYTLLGKKEEALNAKSNF